MLLKRLSQDADLGATWLMKAVEEGLMKHGNPPTLYVPPALIETGRRLCRETGYDLVVDDRLPPDAWYLKGDFSGVFSPGA